eukprot:scaffold249113_cov28-Prasinocladus_malaysianus.AAC.1
MPGGLKHLMVGVRLRRRVWHPRGVLPGPRMHGRARAALPLVQQMRLLVYRLAHPPAVPHGQWRPGVACEQEVISCGGHHGVQAPATPSKTHMMSPLNMETSPITTQRKFCKHILKSEAINKSTAAGKAPHIVPDLCQNKLNCLLRLMYCIDGGFI